MKLNYLDNKLFYYYNNYYHILPCLEVEYKRQKLLESLDKDIKNKFPTFKKSIYEVLIRQVNKKLDPVLDLINLDDVKLTNFINNRIKFIIDELSRIVYKNEKVYKIISESSIKLKYKDLEVEIPGKIYTRIRHSIIDDSYKYFCNYDSLLWMIYIRYIKMHLYNNSQGATTESHYKEIQLNYGSQIEGFGSIFNHTLPYYFGLFPDLEQYFGCLGNFYESTIRKGFYLVNPPFTVLDINKTIIHLLHQLDKSTDNLTFLLVIPAWDNNDRRNLNKVCKTNLQIYDYDDKLELEKCKRSKYLRKYYLYCKENYEYYNFLLDKKAHFSATNLILLSNTKNTFNIQNIFGKPSIVVYESRTTKNSPKGSI